MCTPYAYLIIHSYISSIHILHLLAGKMKHEYMLDLWIIIIIFLPMFHSSLWWMLMFIVHRACVEQALRVWLANEQAGIIDEQVCVSKREIDRKISSFIRICSTFDPGEWYNRSYSILSWCMLIDIIYDTLQVELT